MRNSIAPEHIARAILILRGQRVLQDSELAALYGVSTKRFNQQVRRNRKRFPADFMFQLTADETSSLRSQIATLKTSGGQHRKFSPYVEETSSLRSQIATLKDRPRPASQVASTCRTSSQNMAQSWLRGLSTALARSKRTPL